MTDTNVFALAQVIKAAGSDPSNVTDAVWVEGYRKPELSAEDAVNLALDIICGFEGADLPWECWPKDYTSILKCELNELVVTEMAEEESSAAWVALEIIAAGYSKEATSD